MSSEEYDRLARWEGIKYLPKLIVGTIRDRRIMNYMANNEPTSDESADGLSLFYLIRTCKEIVFYKEDGQEKFGLVTFGLDAKTLRICVTSGLELTPNNENDCLQILAFAQVEEVPVLPRYE